MVRVKVFLSNGQNKLAAVQDKKKCAQWLNLLHGDWKRIELSYDNKVVDIDGKLSLEEWVSKNG